MPRKRETVFKDNVNRRIDFHNQTTYTPYYNGTPDHWYSKDRDLWIEFKFKTSRPREYYNWEKLLSPDQFRWCTNRYLEGRHVWVVVGIENGRKARGYILRAPSHSILKDGFDLEVVSVPEIAKRITRHCTYGH
jgi:hypothetical protein